MLFIMAIALMPLGLIALFASIQSASNKQRQHVAEAHIIASAQARQVELVLLRIANVIRPVAASANIVPDRCSRLLADAERALRQPMPLAVFADDGRLLCRSSDGTGLRMTAHQPTTVALALHDRPPSVQLSAAAADRSYAVAEIPAGLLRAAIAGDETRQGLALEQGAHVLALQPVPSRRLLDRVLTVRAPLAGARRYLSPPARRAA